MKAIYKIREHCLSMYANTNNSCILRMFSDFALVFQNYERLDGNEYVVSSVQFSVQLPFFIELFYHCCYVLC